MKTYKQLIAEIVSPDEMKMKIAAWLKKKHRITAVPYRGDFKPTKKIKYDKDYTVFINDKDYEDTVFRLEIGL